MNTKVCTNPKCGKELPATTEFFHKKREGKFGVRGECKECVSKKEKKRNNPVNTDANIKQVCTGDCGKEKPATLDYFNRSRICKYGVNTKCKECISKKRKEINNPVNTDASIKQVCTGECGKEKPATLDHFYRRKIGKFGVRGQCKECCNQWRKDNPEYYSEYQKDRYQNDEQFRIRQLLSNGLWRALNNIGQSKNASTLDYIGCDIEFLKQHLNSTIDDGWRDVELDIDHIIPQSLYDLTKEEEIKKVYNWRNLRYLPGSENRSKGDILDMALVKEYGIDDLLPNHYNEE